MEKIYLGIDYLWEIPICLLQFYFNLHWVILIPTSTFLLQIILPMHSKVYKIRKFSAAQNHHNRSQIVSKDHIKYKAKKLNQILIFLAFLNFRRYFII